MNIVNSFKNQIFFGVLTILTALTYFEEPTKLGFVMICIFMTFFWFHTHGHTLFRRLK